MKTMLAEDGALLVSMIKLIMDTKSAAVLQSSCELLTMILSQEVGHDNRYSSQIAVVLDKHFTHLGK